MQASIVGGGKRPGSGPSKRLALYEDGDTSYYILALGPEFVEEGSTAKGLTLVFGKKQVPEVCRTNDETLLLQGVWTPFSVRNLEDFVDFLFDAAGAPRTGAYHDLISLQERLSKLKNELEHYLAGEAMRFVVLRKAGERESKPRGSDLAEPTEGVIREHQASKARLDDAFADWVKANQRHMALGIVLRRFEISGRPPTTWEVIQERQRGNDQARQSSPFDLQINAVRAVLSNQKHSNGLRYNSELYERAAEVAGIAYEDPKATFRKSFDRHFKATFNTPVPNSPQEWRAFFENSPQSAGPSKSKQRTGQE